MAVSLTEMGNPNLVLKVQKIPGEQLVPRPLGKPGKSDSHGSKGSNRHSNWAN